MLSTMYYLYMIYFVTSTTIQYGYTPYYYAMMFKHYFIDKPPEIEYSEDWVLCDMDDFFLMKKECY